MPDLDLITLDVYDGAPPVIDVIDEIPPIDVLVVDSGPGGGGMGAAWTDMGDGTQRLYHPTNQATYFLALPDGGLALTVNGLEVWRYD